jgi:hypothetical protein
MMAKGYPQTWHFDVPGPEPSQKRKSPEALPGGKSEAEAKEAEAKAKEAQKAKEAKEKEAEVKRAEAEAKKAKL